MKELTVFIISNEAYPAVVNHKDKLIAHIIESMGKSDNNINRYNLGNYKNALTIINTGNIDIPKLYLTHASNLIEFGYNNNIGDIEYRKGLINIAKSIIQQEEQIIQKIEENTNSHS